MEPEWMLLRIRWRILTRNGFDETATAPAIVVGDYRGAVFLAGWPLLAEAGCLAGAPERPAGLPTGASVAITPVGMPAVCAGDSAIDPRRCCPDIIDGRAVRLVARSGH